MDGSTNGLTYYYAHTHTLLTHDRRTREPTSAMWRLDGRGEDDREWIGA